MNIHPQRRASGPFLRWAGGKGRLLSQLLPHLPLRTRLVEPFVGGGSVFLAADYDRYLINDANSDLAAVWVALKQRPRQYVEAASSLFVESNRNGDAYNRIRERFNRSVDRFDRAACIPYLNKFAFNGLFRVNRRGEHNVPYARPAAVPRFPYEEMSAAASKLAYCEVRSGGFASVLADCGVGDAVYCDPPYVPSSAGKSFTGYTSEGFGIEAQRTLVSAARLAVSRGATVLISNHDTEEARALYRGWETHSLIVRRSIGADQSSRRNVSELLAILRPEPLKWRVNPSK